MLLYHRTDDADVILVEGFSDGGGRYLTSEGFSGVWLSDSALDLNEGAEGEQVLAVEMPEDLVDGFEWVEEDKGYREFLVPADIVNSYGPPRLVEPDEDGSWPTSS